MSLPDFLKAPRSPGPLLASALLLSLATPPFHLLFPSFVGLVPFALWVADLPGGHDGRREALRGGYLLGLVYFGATLYWMFVALVFYTGLAVLAYALTVLILSALLALATLAMHETRTRLGWPLWAVLAVFWTAMEWTRAHMGDVSFPWIGLGDTLTGFPWLIGVADVVGSRGVSLWLLLVNGMAAELVRRKGAGRLPRGLAGAGLVPRSLTRGPDPGAGPGDPATGRPGTAWRLLLALALLLAVPAGYSLHRWHGLELASAARVGVVQPDVPEDVKMDRTAAVDSALRSSANLVETRLAAEVDRLDLIVLPETVFPVYPEPLPEVGGSGRPDLRRWVGEVARRFDARVAFGALGCDLREDGGCRPYNSAFLADGSGRYLDRYDKRHLVPVVERVPFVDPDGLAGLTYFGGFAQGERLPVLQASNGAGFGVLICYESIFPRAARAYRNAGADFLVNMTNDAWFGRDEPWWSRTTALWQHPAHLVMRAVENRVGIARSANTGISLVIDPLGRITHETDLFAPAAFPARVLTTDERTLYTRFGDLAGWGAALLGLGAIAALLARGRP
ncbi:MAG: apolipoprotein N-acyltransferase [Gemmatimonadota bacterium]